LEEISNSANPFKQFSASIVEAASFLSRYGNVHCLTRNYAFMKKCVGLLIVIAIVLSACASSKPYYKTAEGKRKQKYYNDIQFGGSKAKKGY
jgi:hypothetical protein